MSQYVVWVIWTKGKKVFPKVWWYWFVNSSLKQHKPIKPNTLWRFVCTSLCTVGSPDVSYLIPTAWPNLRTIKSITNNIWRLSIKTSLKRLCVKGIFASISTDILYLYIFFWLSIGFSWRKIIHMALIVVVIFWTYNEIKDILSVHFTGISSFKIHNVDP